VGDFDDVEQLQAGIREWLLRSARNGRHELRGIGAPAVLTVLCAAAFGPELASASGVTGIGVLSSVRAGVLAGVLGEAVARARSAHASGTPSRGDVQREVSRSVRQALDAQDKRSGEVRSDIAMVLREIDAGGTMLRAAIEAGEEELQREVLAAVEAVSACFGEMEFMLADLARAAREIQDSLRSQRAELSAAVEQAGRQAADVRLVREELAVIEQRARQYLARPADSEDAHWTGGCPYRGLLPYDQAHEAVFFGRERLTAELAGRLAETGIVILTGARGAGKTSLLQAGLLPALSRGVQVPGSAGWPVVRLAPAAHPLTELAASLAMLGGGDAAAIRRGLAAAPGESHLVIRDLMLSAPRRAGLDPGQAPRLVLIVDGFEGIFAAGEPERAAFIEAVCAAATKPAGQTGEPPALAVIAVRGDYWDRCAGHPQLLRVMQHNQLVVGPMTEAGLRRAITGPAEAGGLRVDPALVDAILADLRQGAGASPLPPLSQAMMLTWQKREGDRLTVRSYQGTGLAGQIARAVEIAAEALTTAELKAASPEGQRPQAGAVLEALARSGRGRWRRRTLAAALAVLVVAALAGAAQAVRSARSAAGQQRTADLSERLAAQSTALDGRDPVTASLLAGAAWRIAPTAQARYGLLESLAQPVRGILATQSGTVTTLAYGPGGRTLAAGYADGTVRLWDLPSHHLIATATWGATALAVAFADGGKALEVASPRAVGTWDLAGGARIAVRPLAGSVAGTAVAFSPDGSVLATGGGDGNVRLWDPTTHQEIGAPMSSDVKPVDAVTFSPDGATIAVASSDGTVQLWDAATRGEAGPAIVAGSAAIAALAFSPDGKTLATGGQDGDVRLWDVTLHSQAGATMAAGGSVAAVAFGARGATLATAESDGTTKVWDVATQDQTGAPLAAQGSAAVSAVAFGAGALATGHGDGSIWLWDPAVFHQVNATAVAGLAGPAWGGHAPAALAGGVLAVSDGHETVRLWDARTGRRIGGAIVSHRVVTGLAVSADGKTLAVATDGVQLWATATGQRIGSPVPASAAAVALGPGGLLATVGTDGTARIWNVATGRQAGAFPVAGGTSGALAFSAGGRTLATADRDGDVRLWDVATGRQAGQIMTGGSTPLYAVAFGPDGTTLATAGADGTARLWDIATQQEIGPPMTAGGQPLFGVAFGPDGSTLATAGADGSTRSWDVAFPQGLLAAACAIAAQPLTRQQWSAYAGTQPYQRVCPVGQ
jgi:WD40 repeat protein